MSDESKLSRREFLKDAAIGAAAAAGSSVLGAATAAAQTPGQCGIPTKWDYETDVLVVGMGYAGLNAAIACIDAGVKVLVLEKAPEKFAGGNSSVSGGGLKIPMNVADGKKYYQALCFGTVPQELSDAMAENMIKVPDQLKKLGITIQPTAPTGTAPFAKLPGSAGFTVPVHAIVQADGKAQMNGRALWLALKAAADKKSIPYKFETAATGLVQDPVSKAILGVTAAEKGTAVNIKAKRAVVLACGGYEANWEWQGYYNFPGLKLYPWGTPYNTGDGIKMISAIGAPLWHTVTIEWDALCAKVASETYGVSVETNIGAIVSPTGAYLIVNKYGKRFYNETKRLVHTKETLELTYFSHDQVEYPNSPFYLIFDETFRKTGPLVAKKASSWCQVHGLYEWSADNSAEITKGWIQKADTLKELAGKIGVDAAGLEATVAKYNGYRDAGADPEFARRKDSLLPLKTPPYYAMELGLTLINTQGGPKHNAKAQTLDAANKPIPRLYTPGELGSFFGHLYPGGSNIPEAIAFGRIAGENAAAEKPWDAVA